ncbi:hypothetical protein BpHYR1_053302 [Brachionus plicatilis]|uniref:Uncharacterized protein n=1 Tax=Brachionus plicatilis TaxID=10195 RepID=A0A3M7T446_BRAPC|nr:hypothetical protein BpHYR1_053302 [Brachionus plicatilis]
MGVKYLGVVVNSKNNNIMIINLFNWKMLLKNEYSVVVSSSFVWQIEVYDQIVCLSPYFLSTICDIISEASTTSLLVPVYQATHVHLFTRFFIFVGFSLLINLTLRKASYSRNRSLHLEQIRNPLFAIGIFYILSTIVQKNKIEIKKKKTTIQILKFTIPAYNLYPFLGKFHYIRAIYRDTSSNCSCALLCNFASAQLDSKSINPLDIFEQDFCTFFLKKKIF